MVAYEITGFLYYTSKVSPYSVWNEFCWYINYERTNFLVAVTKKVIWYKSPKIMCIYLFKTDIGGLAIAAENICAHAIEHVCVFG